MKLLIKLLSLNSVTILVFSLLAYPSVIMPNQVFASFPGYNGKVVFQGNPEPGINNLHSMNPDGSDLQRLTNQVESDGTASFSPDGTKIVFHRMLSGGPDIFIMDADGSNVSNITNQPGWDFSPAWSPDGTKIVYHTSDIWVMSPDGSNKTNLTPGAIGLDGYAAWSPDGTKIVFTSERDGNNEIYVINADGSNPINISNHPSTDNYPEWSPDGTKILFASTRDTGYQDIYVMDADGSNVQRLTLDSSEDVVNTQPVWSPDGKYISWSSTRRGHYDAWIMNVDGTDQKLFSTSLESYYSGRATWHAIPNTPPTLLDKSLTVKAGSSLSIDVLEGATDEEDLDPVNVSIINHPQKGFASMVSGRIKYTPQAGYIGSDELTYKVCDSFIVDQKCSTKVLGISVQAADKPKVTINKVDEFEFLSDTNLYTTTNTRPTFSGTADPFAEIRIEIHSDPIILTTSADENGNWSIIPNVDIPAGEHTVHITASLNGETTTLDSFVLAVQEQLPVTGTNPWPMKASGLALISSGLGLVYWQKRHLQRLAEYKIPALFP